MNRSARVILVLAGWLLVAGLLAFGWGQALSHSIESWDLVSAQTYGDFAVASCDGRQSAKCRSAWEAVAQQREWTSAATSPVGVFVSVGVALRSPLGLASLMAMTLLSMAALRPVLTRPLAVTGTIAAGSFTTSFAAINMVTLEGAGLSPLWLASLPAWTTGAALAVVACVAVVMALVARAQDAGSAGIALAAVVLAPIAVIVGRSVKREFMNGFSVQHDPGTVYGVSYDGILGSVHDDKLIAGAVAFAMLAAAPWFRRNRVIIRITTEPRLRSRVEG